jgi:hypothetical protein
VLHCLRVECKVDEYIPHLIKLDCLLCFSSIKFEQYRWCHKLWQNIAFIVMIIEYEFSKENKNILGKNFAI